MNRKNRARLMENAYLQTENIYLLTVQLRLQQSARSRTNGFTY